eukprot:3412692-Rhodomonas_salina.1
MWCGESGGGADMDGGGHRSLACGPTPLASGTGACRHAQTAASERASKGRWHAAKMRRLQSKKRNEEKGKNGGKEAARAKREEC